MILEYEVRSEQEVMDTFIDPRFFPTDRKVLVKFVEDAKDILMSAENISVLVLCGTNIEQEKIDSFTDWYTNYPGGSIVVVYTLHKEK